MNAERRTNGLGHEVFQELRKCEHCDDYFMHDCYETGHERDSSGCTQLCLTCGIEVQTMTNRPTGHVLSKAELQAIGMQNAERLHVPPPPEPPTDLHIVDLNHKQVSEAYRDWLAKHHYPVPEDGVVVRNTLNASVRLKYTPRPQEGTMIAERRTNGLGHETFEEERWCSKCDEYTMHDCYETGHERDSSGCTQECQTCQRGEVNSMTGKTIDEEIARQRASMARRRGASGA